MEVVGACARRTCALVAGLGQGLVRRWAARPRVLRPIWRSGSFGPAVSTLPGRASILSSAPLDATEWRARRALDATEWRRDWRMPSCRRISCHSTPPSGTRVVHSTPPSGAVRLHPAEAASSPLSYRAGSPDYCESSGLVHGTVAVAPTVRRDDRVHLVAEAAPGVATSRQQIDDLT